jgi:phosphatidyl-myo-inositol dimannoside synthase
MARASRRAGAIPRARQPIVSPRRILTLGHSYVVSTNRRLAHEMAVQGGGRWDVTAVAPTRYRADLGRVSARPFAGEASQLQTVDVHLDRVPHLMWYAGLSPVLDSAWDVVHCWEEPYILAACEVARQTPREAKLVMASFQNIAKDYPWPLSSFERSSMNRADGWIAFGKTVHDALGTRQGYEGKPCRVIPPGVDVERFRPDSAARAAIRSRLGWSAAEFVVGFLGRFVPEKGIELLIDALRASTVPGRALFVGGGPLQPAIDRFAADYPGRVHIANGVVHDGVAEWVNAMTCLCAPSQTTPAWREQFGRMLIEAMACGVPVVASDSGEMPFVIEDAGLVLPESDVSAWASALDRLEADEALRSDLRARGLARVNERFTWPVVARAHLAFFEDLLQGAPR